MPTFSGSSKWTIYDKNGEIATCESKHTIYVTFQSPGSAIRQETLFNLACESADSMTITPPKDVLLKAWPEFESLKVKRMDGSAMGYWRLGPNFYQNSKQRLSAEDLIEFGDGRCESWSRLLMEVLKLNSIANLAVVSVSPAPGDTRKVPNSNPPFLVAMGFTTKQIAGQDNPTPPVNFTNHALTVWNSLFAAPGNPQMLWNLVNSPQADLPAEIYDVSYGTKHTSNYNWESNSLVSSTFAILDAEDNVLKVTPRPQTDPDPDTAFISAH